MPCPQDVDGVKAAGFGDVDSGNEVALGIAAGGFTMTPVDRAERVQLPL